MNDIFSKLNTLKSIEPGESWVVDAKKRVLSEAPVFERKGVLGRLAVAMDSRLRGNDRGNLQNLFQNLSFKKLAIPAFSLVFVLSTGIFTFNASDSSLPGEILYSLKMAKESVTLAIAPENKKAEIEMQQVGKRLEEFDKISENYSDPKQGEKIGMILGEIKVKTNRAEEHLTGIEDNVVKVRVAKIVGTQGEKYTEVLAKTTEELPAVVKDEILEDVAEAIDSNEKIYLTSFAVIAKEEDEIIEEVEVVEETGEEDQEDSVEDGEENTDDEEDAEDKPEEGDKGDVLGDEDENNEFDSVEIDDEEDLDEEEVILDETEEDDEIDGNL